jgi:ribonuclease HIII
MDESGKGDWFGPLVVAAVFVKPLHIPELRKAGVRDSKLLEPGQLSRVATAIERLIDPAARELLVLDPSVYNTRYAPLANINLLLAELYAEAAAAIVQRTGATRVICDQFAQRAERLERAFARRGLPTPLQLHHAETTSVAVAAASVLATARFQAELVRLGELAGVRGGLPPGASAIGLLRSAAQAIIAREGAAGLGRYAKLNFKPVRELLERQSRP